MARNWGAMQLLSGPPTLPLHPASKAYVDAAASNAGANWLNVKALGATGNGATDDSAAIQAVLATAATSGTGNVVYFPAGMYRIGTRLTVPSGVVLRGVSSGTYPGNAAIVESSILARTASMNDHVLYWAAGTAYGHVIDLAIDGNKNNNTSGSGIYLQDAGASEEAQIIVERCYIHDNPDANIYLGHNRRASKILNSVCNYSANSDGILIAGSDNTVTGCIVGSNGRSGIGIGSHNTQNYSGSGFGATVTHVDRCDTYGNTMAGIAVSAFSTLTMITNCGIDRNNRQGVTIYDGSSCSVYGNALHSNGVGTNNTYGHIDLATGVVSCNLIGNQFGPLDGGVTNVASYGITVVNTATVIMGMGNTVDSTATVSGLTNATQTFQLSGQPASAPALVPLGLTGAVAASRYVGATASGAPSTGTFAKGDVTVDQTGAMWVCTVAGSPGTWVKIGASAGVTSWNTRTGAVVSASADYTAAQVTNAADKSSGSIQTFTSALTAPDFVPAGLAGATAASRLVGATATGAPSTGTFVTGDWVIDQTGRRWTCTAGGSPGTWVGSLALDAASLPTVDGIGAAGNSALAAPANHVHPWAGFGPADHGLLGWSQDPADCPNGSVLATAGTLYLVRVRLAVAASATNVGIFVQTAGATLTASQCLAALYSAAGTLIGVTANQATAWQSTGRQTMALASGPFALAAGDYYVGFWYNGTTAPTLARGANQGGSGTGNVANYGIASAYRWATANTGLTTTAPGSLGALTASNLAFWAMVN